MSVSTAPHLVLGMQHLPEVSTPASGAPTMEPDAVNLVLTTRGAHNQLVFDKRALEQDKNTPLTLASHPGKAIVRRGADSGPHIGVWMVTPLGIGSAANAVTATFESGFLTYAHGGAQGKVLDV